MEIEEKVKTFNSLNNEYEKYVKLYDIQKNLCENYESDMKK